MPDDGADLQLVIPGDALAVRHALRAMVEALTHRGLHACDRGTAEIVMAEVLNNIVEHAYAGTVGDISIRLGRTACGIDCCIRDVGHPMPDLCPPRGTLTEWEADAPPEGGFGWHLIRSLTRGLAYTRIGGTNRLSFLLPREGELP